MAAMLPARRESLDLRKGMAAHKSRTARLRSTRPPEGASRPQPSAERAGSEGEIYDALNYVWYLRLRR
jgi:hypothetical protein